jgi:hypothetical protein
VVERCQSLHGKSLDAVLPPDVGDAAVDVRVALTGAQPHPLVRLAMVLAALSVLATDRGGSLRQVLPHAFILALWARGRER